MLTLLTPFFFCKKLINIYEKSDNDKYLLILNNVLILQLKINKNLNIILKDNKTSKN